MSTNKTRSRSAKILIANGVNLDLLGQREMQHYGNFSLLDLEKTLTREAQTIAKAAGWDECEISFFQTNSETAFLEKLTIGWTGALVNAGAWTHTSVALADRLVALALPFVEVHISNVARREEFRQQSYLAPHARGVVFGLGIESYTTALYGLLRSLS